ncbi:hypothetical protein AC579_2652 [Pseudocercospora musae]|uniref:Uncharacterized protein n=1 Tax=Pseudocercospora musae TaxID=113226 RepID=A0A139GTA1_9PEZI|nr:hypothetical protein AC579_2652 [Pseudocercospora musae]
MELRRDDPELDNDPDGYAVIGLDNAEEIQRQIDYNERDNDVYTPPTLDEETAAAEDAAALEEGDTMDVDEEQPPPDPREVFSTL